MLACFNVEKSKDEFGNEIEINNDYDDFGVLRYVILEGLVLLINQLHSGPATSQNSGVPLYLGLLRPATLFRRRNDIWL